MANRQRLSSCPGGAQSSPESPRSPDLMPVRMTRASALARMAVLAQAPMQGCSVSHNHHFPAVIVVISTGW